MSWKKIKSWLLTPPEAGATKDDIVAWWEQRRLAYNAYVILLSLSIFGLNFVLLKFCADGAYLSSIHPASYFFFAFILLGLNLMYAKYTYIRKDPKVAPDRFLLFCKSSMLACILTGFFPFLSSYLRVIQTVAQQMMVR